MIRNLQCLKTLTFVILFLLLVHGTNGEKKDGPVRNNPKPNRGPPCASLLFLNGEVSRTQNKFEYTCKSNFTMFGRKTSRCVNGSLIHPPPVCTATGCPPIGRLNNMLKMTEPKGYKEMVIEFSCNPGYILRGPDRIHCNGLRWNRGQPQCIEDVVSTTSPTTPRKEAETTTPSVFLITYVPPPMESPTIFRSRWTPVHSVQSSAVHITSSLPTSAPDSYATTPDFGDITSSSSTENKELQSSAVTTASHESEKAPTTSEMPEDAQTETQQSILEDDSPSSFDDSMRRVTTQIDEKPGLTSQASITEIDEAETTMEEFPSSPAGDFLSSIDIMGQTDAGISNEGELRRETSPKINDPTTEVGQVKSEPLTFIASTATYPKEDQKTPEPMKSTAQDGDKSMGHATTEAQLIRGSALRSIFQTTLKQSRKFNDEKYENPEYQVTVALIVLAVVAACVLIALVTYVVVIKVKAYRSRDPSQNEHAAVAYEKEVNGSSAANDANVNCHITQL